MSRDAWTMVADGFVTGSVAGAEIPVLANVPAAEQVYWYAVTVTNTDAAVRSWYMEPHGALNLTGSLGTPIKSDADAVSVFSPRDLNEVITLGNPRIFTDTDGHTGPVTYRIYTQTR